MKGEAELTNGKINTDMDYRVFIMHMRSFYMHKHIKHTLVIRRTFVESAQNLTGDSGDSSVVRAPDL